MTKPPPKHLADFKLHAHATSPRWFRVRIFATKADMLATAHAEGAMEGDFKAAFASYGERLCNHVGDIFLYHGPYLRTDAVHELVHAACYYVRYHLRGNLSDEVSEHGASKAEEQLCECVEHLVVAFSVELLKREKRIRRLLSTQTPPCTP